MTADRKSTDRFILAATEAAGPTPQWNRHTRSTLSVRRIVCALETAIFRSAAPQKCEPPIPGTIGDESHCECWWNAEDEPVPCCWCGSTDDDIHSCGYTIITDPT